MVNNKRLLSIVCNFQENGLKVLLENPGNIDDLLKLLGVHLRERINFKKMEVVPGRFVARDYRHLESDIVLRAPIQPNETDRVRRRIILYILIEHQSEPDRFMPFRALEYLVMIYKKQMRNWQEKHGNLDKFNLQPVLPIVLYTGTRTWDKLGNLWELVNLGAEFQQWIPALEPLFLNVGQASAAELTNGEAFGRLLQLVQQRRAPLPVFEKLLGEVVTVLERLTMTKRGRWLDLLSYIQALIYNERDVPDQKPLIAKVVDAVQNDAHRKEVFDMGKTIAEYLKDEGRKEGRVKGLEEGLEKGEVRNQRRMLVRLLRNRFGKIPAAMVKQIEATERIDLLNTWFDQASAAKKLEDVSFTAE